MERRDAAKGRGERMKHKLGVLGADELECACMTESESITLHT